MNKRYLMIALFVYIEQDVITSQAKSLTTEPKSDTLQYFYFFFKKFGSYEKK